MKKLIALLVAVMMVSVLALSALPVFAAGETDDGVSGSVVYLSGEGSDENDGSRENPVATLVKAYELLGAEGGTVCLIGDLTIAEEYRALCDLSADSVGPVTLTSEGDVTLTINSTGIWFPSDTVIETIHLHCTYTEFNSYLVANCNSLTIGENVTVTKAEEAYGYPIIYGSGFYSFAYMDKFSNENANVTIQSGTWAEVYAGGGANGWGHVDDVPGNATVTVTGGTIGTLYGGGNGSVGGEREVAIEGNVRLDISGGTIEQVIANGKTANAPIKGDVTVRITGGEITMNKRYAEEGEAVTLTAIPDEGYELDTLTVIDSRGRELDLKYEENGEYSFKMPAGRVEIEVSFREIGSVLPFTDVAEDHWAVREISWALENGYMNGTSAATFHPSGTVSRQQVWMILSRMAGADPADMAAAKAWAMANGISDGTNPGGAVTRQQLAALLYRFAVQNGYDVSIGENTNLLSYTDFANLSEYAIAAMQWACGAGIINGTGDGSTLSPQGSATRAQLAVMLYRWLA